jgi:hypothetical protein
MAARLVGPPSGESSDPGSALDAWLWVPPPQRAADRLRIYRSGYPARVHDLLADSYPAVARILGAQAFAALTRRYAASVPLTSYNLDQAAAHMPALLRGDALTHERPFLPDLAQLEWRVAVAFHAAERLPLDPRTLGWSVDDWATAVLHFQPSVAVVSSRWPVFDLWAARDTPGSPVEIDLDERPEDIVVRRADYVVRCESVSAGEALALQLLLEGHCLAETAARVEAAGDEPDAVLAWFSRWTVAGMIAAAHVK